MPRIEVRELTAYPELLEAVRLQKSIWGFDDVELLPVRLFVVATKIGGQVLGAFDGERMAGFSIAIPGVKPDGGSFLHSQMMGVVAEYRNAGVGRSLKWKQREIALAAGIPLIEWTFDPLESKNAFFNIERLGAIVRRYVLNQYGTTSSHLHGGLPTDRCIAEWHLNSDRVTALAAGKTPPRPPVLASIEVPTGMDDFRRSEPARAREIQAKISEEFLNYFRQGLAVTGFAGNAYQLSNSEQH